MAVWLTVEGRELCGEREQELNRKGRNGGARGAKKKAMVWHVMPPFLAKVPVRGQASRREVDRVAAPLLGGVRGWVYFHATPHMGIIALRISALLQEGTGISKVSRKSLAPGLGNYANAMIPR